MADSSRYSSNANVPDSDGSLGALSNGLFRVYNEVYALPALIELWEVREK